MIHDPASHRVFKVDELIRLIARQLVPSKRSAVNLACASRWLEEPVLSTLWEKQQYLEILLETLPKGTWSRRYTGYGEIVVRGLDLLLEKSNA